MALIQVGSSLPTTGFEQLGLCFAPWPTTVHQQVVVGPAPAPGGEGGLDPTMFSLIAPRAQIYMFESGPTLKQYPIPVRVLQRDLPRLINAALNPRNTGGKRVSVISMSFGWCEASVPRGALAATEAAFKRATKLGVTVLAAAGDAGSLGTYTPRGGKPTCVPWPVRVKRDKRLRRVRAGVFYPASSPFVTAVGGTELAIDGKIPVRGATAGGLITDEVVWNQRAPADPYATAAGWPDLYFAGGGGQSIFFSTRDAPWQRAIGLTGALHKPDIAALARRPYSLGGSLGTSAASPLMAGAIAVLDSYLDAHHVAPVGPLNQLLYHVAAEPKLYRSVFHDIVHGNNDLLGVGCCRAKPGYDEASGLGSLDIGALARLLLTDPSVRK